MCVCVYASASVRSPHFGGKRPAVGSSAGCGGCTDLSASAACVACGRALWTRRRPAPLRAGRWPLGAAPRPPFNCPAWTCRKGKAAAAQRFSPTHLRLRLEICLLHTCATCRCSPLALRAAPFASCAAPCPAPPGTASLPFARMLGVAPARPSGARLPARARPLSLCPTDRPPDRSACASVVARACRPLCPAGLLDRRIRRRIVCCRWWGMVPSALARALLPASGLLRASAGGNCSSPSVRPTAIGGRRYRTPPLCEVCGKGFAKSDVPITTRCVRVSYQNP